MTTVAAQALRLSSVTNSCPRKAVYEATGAPARERTDREERVLFRGRRLGRDFADMLAEKYGEDMIERERKVVWPLGVGHIDVYLPETKTAIEILSSAHASEQQTHGKLLQLVGYIENDTEAENGVLVILNPADYTEDRIVVSPASARYTELVEEMAQRVDQVLRWSSDGTLPDRVCGKPSEAVGRFCLHADYCFAGWEPPPLEQVAASPELVAAVETFAQMKRARSETTAVDKDLERRQKEAQAIIEAAELPVGVEVQVGSFKVRRTAVARKPTFEWEKAELAGVFEPGLYGQFFREGASYSTFRADRVDPSDADLDYGDVPF